MQPVSVSEHSASLTGAQIMGPIVTAAPSLLQSKGPEDAFCQVRQCLCCRRLSYVCASWVGRAIFLFHRCKCGIGNEPCVTACYHNCSPACSLARLSCRPASPRHATNLFRSCSLDELQDLAPTKRTAGEGRVRACGALCCDDSNGSPERQNFSTLRSA